MILKFNSFVICRLNRDITLHFKRFNDTPKRDILKLKYVLMCVI